MYTGHLPKLVISDVITLHNEALTVFTLCLTFFFSFFFPHRLAPNH